MPNEASRALHEAYEAYPASWRRKRRSPHIDIWAASMALDWLAPLTPRTVDILDIGCGAVWLSERLSFYGPITGIDTAHLVRPAFVRALAHGEYAQDPASLPRYLTAGAASAKSCEGFSVALALGAPALPGDLVQFRQNVAAVMSADGLFVWNPPTPHAFNQAIDWQTCLGAGFSILDVAHLTTPFDDESEAMIMLTRRNT